MKSNLNIIITGALALTIGLTAGYFLFTNKSPNPGTAQVMNSNSIQVPNSETNIWTCSMHPQIRNEEEGDCPICGMDLIPLESNTSNDPTILEMTTEAVKLANIQTTEISALNSEREVKKLQLSGKIEADERRAFNIVSHLPGRIEKLYVSFTGETIKKGQKIAEIYSPELISAQQEFLEAMKLNSVNPNLLEAAKKKIEYWKVDSSFVNHLMEKKSIQETFGLYADQAGTVSVRNVALGDYVKKGEALLECIDLNRVWVVFDAYESDLADIRKGDQIKFSTPAVPNREFITRVNFIDPLIDPEKRVSYIRGEISNGSGLLKPEMLIQGVLERAGSSNASVAVPKSAVLWTGTRSVVYVKLPNSTVPSFQYREIELGERIGDQYEVISGLETGDEVVTNGSFTIDAAAQLNNQASMMNKSVMIKGLKDEENIPDYMASTTKEFKQSLKSLTRDYLVLKDALVGSNPKDAQTATGSLKNSLFEIENKPLKGEAAIYWESQKNIIEQNLQLLEETQDLEAQRSYFEFISDALIRSIQSFGVEEDTFFVQHCPMAFDNKGADWISDIAEVRNPYFGDLMLKCGWVADTLGMH